jgi:hypothetical protein
MRDNKVPDKIPKHQLQIRKMSCPYCSGHRNKCNAAKGIPYHTKSHQIPGRLFITDEIGVCRTVSGGIPTNAEQYSEIQQNEDEYGKGAQHRLQKLKILAKDFNSKGIVLNTAT